jgi:Protein of unknown function (DUF2786)
VTDPASSIRKLLRLAGRAGTDQEARLAMSRAKELAHKHGMDAEMLAAAPEPATELCPRKYDWFSGKWMDLPKW